MKERKGGGMLTVFSSSPSSTLNDQEKNPDFGTAFLETYGDLLSSEVVALCVWCGGV